MRARPLRALAPRRRLPAPDWVRLGMAAKAAGLTFEDWHDWSATAGNYRNQADCRSTWNSMKGDGIRAGTVFAAARRLAGPDPLQRDAGQSSICWTTGQPSDV